ncbi:MAG: hypothetical protein LBI74_06890 [Synergistaceae bacterium]|jgi:hypothetical protein|nr:hypothetical protein [Synergistaceae bacterium]
MPRGRIKRDEDKEYLNVKVDKDKFEVLQALLLLSHQGIDETLENLIDEYIQTKGKEFLQLDKINKKK